MRDIWMIYGSGNIYSLSHKYIANNRNHQSMLSGYPLKALVGCFLSLISIISISTTRQGKKNLFLLAANYPFAGNEIPCHVLQSLLLEICRQFTIIQR
jgi:hypothetical protein